MKIINTKTNTEPLFVHAQGFVHNTNVWNNIVISKPLISVSVPDNVTILTFIQGNLNFSLPVQLANSNIKFENCIPSSLTEWTNTMKIKYLSEYLDNITTEYVVGLDALDILCCDNLGNLVNIFEGFDADIVFNASKLNYPVICKDIEKTNSRFRYLNAGAFIGRTVEVKRFYKFLVDTELYKDYKTFQKSEQIRVRVGRENYDKRERIKVDTECAIFQTLNMAQFTFNGDILTIKE